MYVCRYTSNILRLEGRLLPSSIRLESILHKVPQMSSHNWGWNTVTLILFIFTANAFIYLLYYNCWDHVDDNDGIFIIIFSSFEEMFLFISVKFGIYIFDYKWSLVAVEAAVALLRRLKLQPDFTHINRWTLTPGVLLNNVGVSTSTKPVN